LPYVQAFKPPGGGSGVPSPVGVSLLFFLSLDGGMTEELEEMCRKLRLSDHEKQNLRLRTGKIQQSKEEAKFSLLFRLLTNRSFNGEAFKGTVRNLWGTQGNPLIRDIEDNLFMAVFQNRDDMERVVIQGPWTFDKKLIQVKRMESDTQPTAVKFIYAAFWIRVYNLPILSMVRDVGEDIGNDIGRVVEVDVPENGIGWGRFLRIRVEIDVTKPLLRGKILEDGEGKPFWVDFKYEHLPIFCYRCGRIGHSGNECLEGRRSGGDRNVSTNRFGSWLRAIPVRGVPHRRPRETVNSDDDWEGVSSQGGERAHEGGAPVGVPDDLGAQNQGADIGESLSRARIPESMGRVEGDEVEDTGVSEGLGEMDMHDVPNMYPAAIVHGGVDYRTELASLVATSEEQTEVVIQLDGKCVGDSSTQPQNTNISTNPRQLERNITVAPVPTKLEDNNIGADATDAILLVGGQVTMLPSVLREQSLDGKGKNVVGTTPRIKWKKRARVGDSYVPPLQDVGQSTASKKRSLELGDASDVSEGLRLKKRSKGVSGVVSHNDPTTAEADGQPRRSQ
jgi:hypothetical protein